MMDCHNSTAITLDGLPCVVADAERLPQIRRLANSYWCPVGPAVGRAYVLILRRDLDVIRDANSTFHELVFQTRRRQGKPTRVAIGRLLLEKSERLLPGSTGASESLCLVHLADRRLLVSNFSDSGNLQINVRAKASDTDYLVGTEGHTWSSAAAALWDTMTTVLGNFPGLPTGYTPHGVPENLHYRGVNSWYALGQLLQAIDCTVRYDPLAGQFDIIRLSQPQADLPSNLATRDRIFAAEATNAFAWKIPETVRVYFRNHYRSYGQEADTQISGNWSVGGAIDYIDVATGAVAAIPGTVMAIWDSLPRILDEDNSLTNSSDLTTRANERAANWLASAQLADAPRHDILPGIATDILPGAEVKAVLWRAWGPHAGGTATELISHTGLPQDVYSTNKLGETSSLALSLDQTQCDFPTYPRLPNFVQVWNTGQAAGVDITSNVDNLFPGRVRRWVAGTMATLDDCWIRLVDDHDNDLGDVTVVNGEFFYGRLSGIETSESTTRPIYLAKRGCPLSQFGIIETTGSTSGDGTINLDNHKFNFIAGDNITLSGSDSLDRITINATAMPSLDVSADTGSVTVTDGEILDLEGDGSGTFRTTASTPTFPQSEWNIRTRAVAGSPETVQYQVGPGVLLDIATSGTNTAGDTLVNIENGTPNTITLSQSVTDGIKLTAADATGTFTYSIEELFTISAGTSSELIGFGDTVTFQDSSSVNFTVSPTGTVTAVIVDPMFTISDGSSTQAIGHGDTLTFQDSASINFSVTSVDTVTAAISGTLFTVSDDYASTNSLSYGDTLNFSDGNGMGVNVVGSYVVIAVDSSVSQKIVLAADGGTVSPSGPRTILASSGTVNAFEINAGTNITLTDNADGSFTISANASGGGSFDDWIASDGTTPLTVSDGETLKFLAGTNMTVTAATSPDERFTFDCLYDWKIDSDDSSSTTVANDDILDCAGGNGTVTSHATAAGRHTVTIETAHRWGRVNATWQKNAGDWRVSVKHSTRAGVTDGAAFNIYIPVVDHLYPNLESGDIVTYREADDGTKVCTSPGAYDDPVGTIKMWDGNISAIKHGWQRMTVHSRFPKAQAIVGETPLNGTDTASNTPAGTGGNFNHTHVDHDDHTHVQNKTATGGTGTDLTAPERCTSGVRGASGLTPCNNVAATGVLGHDTVNHEPHWFFTHFIQRIDNSI